MTTARWFSLITGCLAFFLNYSSEGNPPNFWDFLLVLTYKATAAFLIAAPMILEYLEREKEKNILSGKKKCTTFAATCLPRFP